MPSNLSQWAESLSTSLVMKDAWGPITDFSELARASGFVGLIFWGISLTLIPLVRGVARAVDRRKQRLETHFERLLEQYPATSALRLRKRTLTRHFIAFANLSIRHHESHETEQDHERFTQFAIDSGLTLEAMHILQRSHDSAALKSALRLLDCIERPDASEEAMLLLKNPDRPVRYQASKYLIDRHPGETIGFVMAAAVSEPVLTRLQIKSLLAPLPKDLIEEGFWYCLSCIPLTAQSQLMEYLPYLPSSSDAFPLNFFLPLADRESWLLHALEHLEDPTLYELALPYRNHPSAEIRTASNEAAARLRNLAKSSDHLRRRFSTTDPTEESLLAWKNSIHNTILPLGQIPYE
jgi:hypothetical protein